MGELKKKDYLTIHANIHSSIFSLVGKNEEKSYFIDSPWLNKKSKTECR